MRIHFIGINGIGVSALAQYYLATGHKTSGSDLVSSEITKTLKKQGVKILTGQKAKNITPALDLVIYSTAVKEDNPELKEAKKLDIKCQTYPEALGELTKKHFTIAVAGTHGKSTTTAMLSLILIKAGLDPTVIVGTKLRELSNTIPTAVEKVLDGEGSNFRMGKSKYLIIEACEYEEAFLNYWPKVIALTNIEREHLDYYKNLKNILRAFTKFVGHLPEKGILVANRDDKNIRKILGSRASSGNSCSSYYSFRQNGIEKLKKILKVPGEYNIYNALAALATARVLKIPDKISFKALSEYKGAWRRFEISAKSLDAKHYTLINDYAHHPTEIKATLKAAQEKFPNKVIWCVFQPHQYQRTFYLFNDFTKVFTQALREKWLNNLIIIDIYDVAGREGKGIKQKVSSKGLTGKIKGAIYIPNVKRTIDYLKKNLKDREVVIIMGAGDIFQKFSTGAA